MRWPDGDAAKALADAAKKASEDLKPAVALESRNRAREIYGMGKGKSWMSEDFDAPLEDFAKYM